MIELPNWSEKQGSQIADKINKRNLKQNHNQEVADNFKLITK